MQYHKIYSPFKRDSETHKLIPGEWSYDYFMYTDKCSWIFTDKIDGMNIRIIWDGHNVAFGGRKEKSIIPGNLLEYLERKFTEEMFEDIFGEKEVVLYGEGCGGNIQSMSHVYGTEKKFILFDVYCGCFLLHSDVSEIGSKFNVETSSIMCIGDLYTGIEYVKNNNLTEGLIGVLEGGMLSRSGNRIITKIKNVDFK